MPDPDLTLAILREIRAKLDETNTGLNAKLDAAAARLDRRVDELRDAVFEGFDLIGEKLTDFAKQLLDMTHYQKVTVRNQIRSLDARVIALEQKVG